MSKDAVAVGKGQFFVDKEDNKKEVVVFQATPREVAYAPVGESSEFRVTQEEFLDKFKPRPEPAKKD